MRLQRYLKEKFYDAFKKWGDEVEIFMNPNSKEIKEIKSASGLGTIRFFANMKEKKVYMWNGDNAIHQDVVDNGLKPTQGFDYDGYALSGRNADIIFGGTIENGRVESDSWDARPTARYPRPDLAKRADKNTLPNVKKMAKQDFSWLKKHGIDPNDVKSIVDSLVTYLEDEWG